MEAKRDLVELAASIVSAYVSGNVLPPQELQGLIKTTHATLVEISHGRLGPSAEPSEPAVPIKRSITPEHIICLEDGKRFKSLKRHLRTRYGMSPDDYRTKWGLPADYPMVAPNYARERSNLAKKMGLGLARKGG